MRIFFNLSHSRHTLLLSCTDLSLAPDLSSFSGVDCVNGSLVPHRQLTSPRLSSDVLIHYSQYSIKTSATIE